MSTSKKTPVPDVLANVTRGIAAMRQSLEKAISDLDALIRERDARLNALQRAVNRKEAAALIVGNMRSELQERRAKLVQRAAGATRLNHYVATVDYGTINADGQHIRTEHDVHRLQILPYDLDVLDLAALVLDDAKIAAFAQTAVADAPTSGPSVAELQAEMQALDTELSKLHQDRHAWREQLHEFVQVNLSPLVPDEFFRRHTDPGRAPEDGAPNLTRKELDPTAPMAWQAASPSIEDEDDGEVVAVEVCSVAVPSASAHSMNPQLGPDRLRQPTFVGAGLLDDIEFARRAQRELEERRDPPAL